MAYYLVTWGQRLARWLSYWSAGSQSGYDSICKCTAAPSDMLADEAAGALGWAGTVVPALEYAGALIDVVARINEPELERRSRPDPVVDRALLRTLMELPSGIEIPLDALGNEHLVTLQLDGDGLVEWTGHGVRRTYEPACEVVGVLATGRHLRQAVDDVSAFSGYSLRAVYGTLRQCEALRGRAATFGVGLVATGELGPIVVGAPERRGTRPTPSRWRFCELVYERWSSDLSETAATR